MKNTTQIIAWIALIISLTGGIPGIISTYKSVTKYPKLSFILRNSVSGSIFIDGKEKSFLLIVLTIGNRGSASFKRFVNPEAEIRIANKWIKLTSLGLSDSFINNMSNQIGKNAAWLEVLKNKTIKDYYFNNFAIAPSESYDVFLYFDADSDKISNSEITNQNNIFRITLTDVKNKKYTKKFKRE